MTMSWADYGTITAIGSAVMCILFWALRGRLMNDFVSKLEHDEDEKRMQERLDNVEQRLQLVPSHDDFRLIVGRVADVARDVAVGNAHTQGMKESLVRIERQLTLFVQARLDWEKSQ
jgi:hypothetical protein